MVSALAHACCMLICYEELSMCLHLLACHSRSRQGCKSHHAQDTRVCRGARMVSGGPQLTHQCRRAPASWMSGSMATLEEETVDSVRPLKSPTRAPFTARMGCSPSLKFCGTTPDFLLQAQQLPCFLTAVQVTSSCEAQSAPPHVSCTRLIHDASKAPLRLRRTRGVLCLQHARSCSQSTSTAVFRPMISPCPT